MQQGMQGPQGQHGDQSRAMREMNPFPSCPLAPGISLAPPASRREILAWLQAATALRTWLCGASQWLPARAGTGFLVEEKDSK